MNDTALYDREELWQPGRPLESYQQAVLRDVLNLLPDDARSILDVGCGDGFITNALPRDRRVVGLDVGAASLSHVTRETMTGTATELPCPDAAFDLVMANDVIEHIPEHDYAKALSELQRVAGKYLLIAVPFLENLRGGRTLCAHCGATFHINQHQRAFGMVELVRLFSTAWTPATVVFSGASITPMECAHREMRSAMGIAASWNLAVCPFCGKQASATAVDKNVAATIDARVSELELRGPAIRPNRTECLVLFRPRSAASDQRADDGERAPIALTIDTSGGQERRTGSVLLEDNRLLFIDGGSGPVAGEYRALEYRETGITIRLPEPEMAVPGSYVVPFWFLPGQVLATSSASERFTESLLMLMELSAGHALRALKSEIGAAVATQATLMEHLVTVAQSLASVERRLNSPGENPVNHR